MDPAEKLRPARGVWAEGEPYDSDAVTGPFERARDGDRKVAFTGIHHTAVIVDDLERSLAFYHGVLGMEVSRNPARPDRNLPFRGAFLKIGHESMHLMELDNPDPLDPAVRPDHGGRDRHFCVGVESVADVIAELEKAGVPYTASKSGRAAVFFRDPDMNTMECLELKAVDGVAPWRA